LICSPCPVIFQWSLKMLPGYCCLNFSLHAKLPVCMSIVLILCLWYRADI
jgi:hypothetical protein